MATVFEFTVPRLLAVVRKGRGMTLYEKADLDTNLAILTGEDVRVDGRQLSDEEAAFVRHVLPVSIRQDVPKLDAMMRFFGLGLDTVFSFRTQPFGGEKKN
jgi:hypothetical protein